MSYRLHSISRIPGMTAHLVLSASVLTITTLSTLMFLNV
jgi:hypothetical protein